MYSVSEVKLLKKDYIYQVKCLDLALVEEERVMHFVLFMHISDER